MKREKGTGIKAWELTDDIWEVAQLFIPERTREEGKTYQRKPGGGKKGTKRSLVVESHGLPVGIVISGANRHDIKLLEATPQSIITAHPEGSNMCLDTGYVGARAMVEAMGYVAHIRGRGEEKREYERNPAVQGAAVGCRGIPFMA